MARLDIYIRVVWSQVSRGPGFWELLESVRALCCSSAVSTSPRARAASLELVFLYQIFSVFPFAGSGY